MQAESTIPTYSDLAQDSLDASLDLPQATIAERYRALIQHKYEQMDAHRAIFANFIAGGLQEGAGDFQRMSGTSDPMYQAVAGAVEHAEDKLTDGVLADAFVNVLYAFHFLLVMFWLYDRTPRHQASQHMLNFVYEMLKLVRPLFFMPMFANALRKFSAILALVFGGVTPMKATPERQD